MTVTPGSVTVTASQTEAIAGRDVVTISATVKDESGNPIVGQPVKFFWPVDVVFPPTGPGVTDANGVASMDVVSHPSGPELILDLRFSATSGGITSDFVTVNFRNPVEIPALVTISASKPSLVSGGQDQLTLTVTATDSNGLPLPGQEMKITMSPSPLWGWGYGGFTDRYGQAQIWFNALNMPVLDRATSVTVGATVSGVAANPVTIALLPP